MVKQLTLDIEHYLGETVRTSADWGHRYLSFTDYDIQIVEVGQSFFPSVLSDPLSSQVSPDTSEVIAVVYVLIRARPPKDPHKHTHSGRSLPKLYQSRFKLLWNLQTGESSSLCLVHSYLSINLGSYNTLDVEDLFEVSPIKQAEIIR